MAANRLPASLMKALDPAAGARRSRLTAARAGAPRCPYISRRSRPTSGQTLTVPSSFRGGELPRRLPAPFARNVIPGAHAADWARSRACLLLAPPGIDAQPTGKVYRIGYLAIGKPDDERPFVDAFRQGLREFGWVEGQNVSIEYRFADGETARL